ncbi:hypothetical protein ACVILH_005672 [Bradyrhizobium sp. USDA 4353]
MNVDKTVFTFTGGAVPRSIVLGGTARPDCFLFRLLSARA